MRTENTSESLQQKVQAVLGELLHGGSIHYQHSNGAVRLVNQNGETAYVRIDPETFLQLQAEKRITQTGKLRGNGANAQEAVLVYQASNQSKSLPAARIAREESGKWLMNA